MRQLNDTNAPRLYDVRIKCCWITRALKQVTRAVARKSAYNIAIGNKSNTELQYYDGSNYVTREVFAKDGTVLDVQSGKISRYKMIER